MMSFIKRSAFAAVLVLSVSLTQAFAADDNMPPLPGTQEYGKQVILRVNGIEFTRGTYDSNVNNAIPRMSMHKAVSDERKEKIRQAVISDMITGELVAEEAAKDKEVVAMVKKKDVEAAIDALVKKLPEGMTLKKLLKNSRMSKDDMRAVLRKDLQAKRLNEKMSKKLIEQADKTVDEAYARDYYQKNLAKFVEPEQVHVRMILLKADPSGGAVVWSAVYKKAKELTDKARGGEDFAKLAGEFSEDEQTAKKGGDLGWQHRGSLMEELDVVSEKMKPGDVSEPINTLYGYVVIKLEGTKPEVQRKFEEINLGNLKTELSDKLSKTLYDGWIDGLWAAAKIEFLAPDVDITKKK
ncbi:MAG: peptidylprolyl isomerase [Deltaproteobacteria bacterium]|nr:peptidylprolyl isomerase [Deltaproteobacteria bacterium]